MDNETYLLARVKAATVDALAALEAIGEDLEDGDEDRCPANEDNLESLGYGGSRGETEDDEDNDDRELVVDGPTREFLIAARARYRVKKFARRSITCGVVSSSGELVGWKRLG